MSDTLSPESAAAAGVELANVLWVRFALPKPKRLAAPIAPPRVEPEATINHRPIGGGCGTTHPRDETKGLAPALEQMLFLKEERRRRKMEGTPGYPNQTLCLHRTRSTGNASTCAVWTKTIRCVRRTCRQQKRQGCGLARTPLPLQRPCRSPSHGDRLDRALRATDQVLQSGGFRIVVLDLASIPPQQALRIPSATWFRFRRAAQESDAILLLLTQEPWRAVERGLCAGVLSRSRRSSRRAVQGRAQCGSRATTD